MAIAGVVTLLALLARAQREELVVGRVEIRVVDSLRNGRLISREGVEQMLNRQGIKLVGERAQEISLQGVERVIAENGLVERVDAYINYAGVLHIEVEQRRPLARLLLDGYNCYITSEGFVFDTPSQTALNTPIITGDYRPLFEPKFEGYIADVMEREVAKWEARIDSVEREKRPVYERERANNEDKREVRKRYINQSMFESDEAFDARVDALRKENQSLRDLYAYRQRKIESELKALSEKQERYRKEQKKARKMVADIENLINFVERVEADDLWRAEVVQIDLEGRGENMRVRLAVRSGGFMVTMGEIAEDREMKAKLKRLRSFYDEALTRVGWERYREINIEYKNQVVCRK